MLDTEKKIDEFLALLKTEMLAASEPGKMWPDVEYTVTETGGFIAHDWDGKPAQVKPFQTRLRKKVTIEYFVHGLFLSPDKLIKYGTE